jgi:hypothetical protein
MSLETHMGIVDLLAAAASTRIQATPLSQAIMCAQDAEDPLGIEEVLEHHHGIISEADKGTSPLETWPHLKLEPLLCQRTALANMSAAGGS